MKKKILIVEDEFVVANDLRLMLQGPDYHITGISDSVEDATAKIALEKPDIVLLDIHLQGNLSGIDLAGRLNEWQIAFIYLSANSNQSTLEKAKATEPYGFLVKPVRQKDLVVTLDIACYKHEHSLESFLNRKEQLRKKLLVLNETQNRSRTLKFVAALQSCVPFDFFSISFSPKQGGEQFSGFYRTGFNEYQQIDLSGLANITGRQVKEITSLLPGTATTPQVFNDGAYQQLLQQDPLAKLLDASYHFQSAIRTTQPAPDQPPATIQLFSKVAGIYTDQHLSLFHELQHLIGPLWQTGGMTFSSPQQTTGNTGLTIMDKIIGRNNLLLHCLDLVAQVAPLNTSVLITGESGTGKELVAEAIHQLSQRASKPFVKINCAALPASLVESELFGYEKGAFTGAIAARTGKFEAASGGTIFLDEIGEMNPDVQAKLLRVLQDKKIERIGGNKTIETDVRIIAATNRHLDEAVAEGRFRLDLYFRLNVFPIQLPSLKERKEDIPLLAQHIAQRICRSMNKEYAGFSNEMMQEMQTYDWPGNVRELENLIEYAVITSENGRPLRLIRSLVTAMSPATPVSPGKFKTIDEIRQQQEFYEKELITSTLRECKGRIRGPGGAAEKLDIKPTTLESMLLRLGIRKEDFL